MKHIGEAALPQIQTAPSAPHRLGPAIVIGAAILALGGAWRTVRLVNSLRESSAEHAAVSAVELPVAPPRGEDISEFSDTRRLTSGWIALLQFQEKQDVRQDGNATTKATVFRLTSETNGVIRFSKTMSLFDCRCIGTFDIDVPIFKTEPIARRKKQ